MVIKLTMKNHKNPKMRRRMSNKMREKSSQRSRKINLNHFL